MSRVSEIAGQVKSEVNAAAITFDSVAFTDAEWYFLPRFEHTDMHTLHVSIVPRSIERSVESRSHAFEKYQIDVAIQKRVDNTTTAKGQLDELVEFAEEVEELLSFNDMTLTGSSNVARFVSIKRDPMVAPDHLEELQQFTAVISVTYQLVA